MGSIVMTDFWSTIPPVENAGDPISQAGSFIAQGFEYVISVPQEVDSWIHPIDPKVAKVEAQPLSTYDPQSYYDDVAAQDIAYTYQGNAVKWGLIAGGSVFALLLLYELTHRNH